MGLDMRDNSFLSSRHTRPACRLIAERADGVESVLRVSLVFAACPPVQGVEYSPPPAVASCNLQNRDHKSFTGRLPSTLARVRPGVPPI